MKFNIEIEIQEGLVTARRVMPDGKVVEASHRWTEKASEFVSHGAMVQYAVRVVAGLVTGTGTGGD